MLLNSFKERQRFLNEIQDKYGKDITLEEILKNLSQINTPISECKFTGLLVYNIRAYELAGEVKEFTGTISEALEDLMYVELDEIEDNMETLIEVFCDQDWTTLGDEKDSEVKLASIDRKVTREEVRAYLQELKNKYEFE